MKNVYLKQYLIWVLWSIVLCAIYFQEASAASPGELIPLESASSPARVTAIEKSSVWLNWAYEYGGDLGHTVVYKEQVIGYTSPSNPTFQPLAKRVGQNGAIKIVPAQPASFYGRVEMISANSTLAIHNIRHSDSSYNFSSHITFYRDFGGAIVDHSVDLKPTVRITVQGKTSAYIFPTSATKWHESATSFSLHGSPTKSTVTGVEPSVSTTWHKSLSSTSSSLHTTTTTPAVTVIAPTEATTSHKSSASVTTLPVSSRTTMARHESLPSFATRHTFPISTDALKTDSEKDKTWIHKVVIASVVIIIVLVIAIAILIAILCIKRRKAKFVGANRRPIEEFEMQLPNPVALRQANPGETGVPNFNCQNQDNGVNLYPKQSNEKNKTKLPNSALVIENKNHITNNDFQSSRQSEPEPWVYQDMSGHNVATRPVAVLGIQQEENVYEEIKELCSNNQIC